MAEFPSRHESSKRPWSLDEYAGHIGNVLSVTATLGGLWKAHAADCTDIPALSWMADTRINLYIREAWLLGSHEDQPDRVATGIYWSKEAVVSGKNSLGYDAQQRYTLFFNEAGQFVSRLSNKSLSVRSEPTADMCQPSAEGAEGLDIKQKLALEMIGMTDLETVEMILDKVKPSYE